MFHLNKEQLELFIYAKHRIGLDIKYDFIESNGFDLEQLFFDKEQIVNLDTPKSYVSTKKKGKNKSSVESENDVAELFKMGENLWVQVNEAEDTYEFSEKKLKELSAVFESSDFDRSDFEYLILFHFEQYFLLHDHEFQNKIQFKTDSEDQIDEEFQKSGDVNLLKNGILKLATVDKDYNFDLHFKYSSYEDDTGYMIPSYNQISQAVSYPDLIKKYDSAVTDFKLKHNKKVSIADVVYISQFRDLMYKQVERQFKVIDSLNEIVKDYLKTAYRIIELLLFQNHKNQNPDTYKNEAPDDWYYFVGMARAIYKLFANNKLDGKELDRYFEKINRIPVLSADFKKNICDILEEIYQKKEPILNITNDLLIKIRCTESIIEDKLMEQTLKKPEEFVEWFSSQSEVTKPEEGITKKDIICRAEELKRQGHTISYVFEKMQKWLLNEKKGFGEKEFKEKYGFGLSDPDTFNKQVLKYKHLCPPENN